MAPNLRGIVKTLRAMCKLQRSEIKLTDWDSSASIATVANVVVLNELRDQKPADPTVCEKLDSTNCCHS